MRTVHEPEPLRGAAGDGPAPSTAKGKGAKIKLTNGSAKTAPLPTDTGPTVDEDGNPVDPSPQNDNITYVPAHHPITGQPGFMIHYPPDINFSAWESSITADQLMRLLRRQVHWATTESTELNREVQELEAQKKEEWLLKEMLLEGLMEAELAESDREQLLRDVDTRVREVMERDAQPAQKLKWTKASPKWRQSPLHLPPSIETPDKSMAQASPSPPPTGVSGGGFDGELNPYDNYLEAQMAAYEERERLKNTPAQAAREQRAAEADAVGALMGMSGK